ncbi:hypothetical protein AB0J90_20325 [Micromonospora sp. NPDC049523]|uniref:hypothetical protein n=1 Tax=Micromonospora sp. NPDC049523 TaxID=3155921 RepID=UPI0034317A15
MARLFAELRAVRSKFESVEVKPVTAGGLLSAADRGDQQDQPTGSILLVTVLDLDDIADVEHRDHARPAGR